MSSRDYSVNDFGYVFNAEMIDQIIEKVNRRTFRQVTLMKWLKLWDSST